MGSNFGRGRGSLMGDWVRRKGFPGKVMAGLRLEHVWEGARDQEEQC